MILAIVIPKKFPRKHKIIDNKTRPIYNENNEKMGEYFMENSSFQSLIDTQYKDASPLNTVELIKSILKEHNIVTQESWSETTVPHCYAVRISVEGTSFGTNGKGLTREFALASGYGELMERLQLGFIGVSDTRKSEEASMHSNAKVRVDVSSLLCNRQWYEKLIQKYYAYAKESMTPEQILQQYADSENKVSALPFYSITQDCKVYFPYDLQKNLYGSNGCAAGNTMEEAIVQAISEIVERHQALALLENSDPLPVIPDAVLEKFETVSKIIHYLRSTGLQIIVKDCSLGKRFPAVCICFIDRQTGKYHTHFGANPVLEIALERALTETFQGRTRENFANMDGFVYQKDELITPRHLNQELIYGVSEKKPVFFLDQEDLHWNQAMGFSGTTNRELLQELVAYFKEDEYEILVQDGSCLGFPTCRVLIPGYSEALIYRLNEQKNEFSYKEYAKKFLRNPSVCDYEEYFGTILHMQMIAEAMPKNYKKTSFAQNAGLSAKLPTSTDVFLKEASLGYIYYALGQYPQAVQALSVMKSCADAKDQESILCLERYINMLIHNYQPEQILEILTCFHKEETVEALEQCLKHGRNPFEVYTLHCDMHCKENCVLYAYCQQHGAKRLIDLIDRETSKMNFESFAAKMSQLLK